MTSALRDQVLVSVAIAMLTLAAFSAGVFFAGSRARASDPDARLAAIEQRLGLAQAAAAAAARAPQAQPDRAPAAAQPAAPAAPIQLDLAKAPALGPAGAPVTLVAFTDFECPFCARVAPTLERLHREYGDRVRIVFKHFPLPIHPQAMLAHQAAAAAGRQGKFWEMFDRIFAAQQTLDRATLIDHARKLGLDVAKFESALDDAEIAAQIRADVAEGSRVGVNGTPTFVLNGQLFSGALPYETFSARVDQAFELHQARADSHPPPVVR